MTSIRCRTPAAMVANFLLPQDLVVGDAGFVSVADRYAIRRVDPAGNVTTIAGNGNTGSDTDRPGSEARFNSPDGIGLFPDGTLIVVDQDGGDRVAIIQRVIDNSYEESPVAVP